jgi:osmotically inducible lipoprotein OsmB
MKSVKRITTLTLLATVVLGLSACGDMNRRQTDTAVGAVGGGVAGAALGGGVLGTAAGAAAGGLIGNQIGK